MFWCGNALHYDTLQLITSFKFLEMHDAVVSSNLHQTRSPPKFYLCFLLFRLGAADFILNEMRSELILKFARCPL